MAGNRQCAIIKAMVAAVIVLYAPDMALLDRLLLSVKGQVEKLFVVDNTPENSHLLARFQPERTSGLTYIPLGENRGIATAHNIGIRESIKAGCSHVLLLDQDSALPAGMVAELLRAEESLLAAGEKVAAVGPLFVDEKTGSVSRTHRHRWLKIDRKPVDQTAGVPVETDYLISSGSLIRTCVLQEIGLMRDELFIDWVDIEWGLRARSRGYRSYIVPTTVLRHSVGDAGIKVLGREFSLHSDIRNCYIVRNATFLLRVRTMGWEWRVVTVPRIPRYILLYSWYSGHRVRSLYLLLRAFRDGLQGRLGRFN